MVRVARAFPAKFLSEFSVTAGPSQWRQRRRAAVSFWFLCNEHHFRRPPVETLRGLAMALERAPFPPASLGRKEPGLSRAACSRDLFPASRGSFGDSAAQPATWGVAMLVPLLMP